jgi:hypothetical protein
MSAILSDVSVRTVPFFHLSIFSAISTCCTASSEGCKLADGLPGDNEAAGAGLAAGAEGVACGDPAGTGCAGGGVGDGDVEGGGDCAAQNAQDKQRIAMNGTGFEIRIVPVFRLSEFEREPYAGRHQDNR